MTEETLEMEESDVEGFSRVAVDHARHPRNMGPLQEFNGHARITGPCGDTMEFWVRVVQDRTEQVSFITDGCGSSVACGSMASVLTQGRNLQDALAMEQRDVLQALGEFPQDVQHCALLAATVLKAACHDYVARTRAAASSAEASVDEQACAADRVREQAREAAELRFRMQQIRHKVVVLSGKGGVGKSTVAVNLAMGLVLAGKRVGLLDADIHGPSIPTMLGMTYQGVAAEGEGIAPVDVDGLRVMSLGLLLPDQDEAVIWRGPMKMGALKQFLKDVVWGELDYLIIDCPPGTGDEPLSVCQLVGDMDGAVVVTTPQKVAAVDVRKSITFCERLGIPVLGVVENMSGFVCPKCGEVTRILRSGAGEAIARDKGVPLLASIPMDPAIADSCDDGRVFVQFAPESASARIMQSVVEPILALDQDQTAAGAAAAGKTTGAI